LSATSSWTRRIERPSRSAACRTVTNPCMGLSYTNTRDKSTLDNSARKCIIRN
jgi:hypothetical protein